MKNKWRAWYYIFSHRRVAPHLTPFIYQDTGLYYDRYLREVIEVLETDPHFREKLQTANTEDIKNGRLSKELDLVSHNVRTRLDELKRQEVSRLRMLLKAKLDSTNTQSESNHA